MKAAQFSRYGGKEVVEISDVALPSIKKDHVAVEIFAAGVNPFDWKLRQGFFEKMIPLTFPFTLGGDFAGIVSSIGKDVTDFHVGDKVYGQAHVLAKGSGSFAEQAIVSSKAIARQPHNVSMIEAAALPLAGVSAVQAILEHMNIQSGQQLLIHGGAGGIGSFGISIAKSCGATVWTTAKSEDIEYVKSLDADHVIDYTTQPFEDLVSNMDAVFDTVGGETYQRSFCVLKKGGVIVSMLEPPQEGLMEKYGVGAIRQNTIITRERLDKLTEFVEKGIVHIRVDRTFPLTQTADALEYQEKEHVRGKVVIVVKESE